MIPVRPGRAGVPRAPDSPPRASRGSGTDAGEAARYSPGCSLGVSPTRRAILSLALLATACWKQAAEPLAVTVDGPVAGYAPEYLSAPDLPSRAAAVAVGAAEVWGAGPRALDGYLLVFEQRPIDCGLAGSDAARVVGCTWASSRTIQVLALGAACPEATAIAHEVGHAVIGDLEHRDPRWRDPSFWSRMLAAMQRTAPPRCGLDDFVEENDRVDDDD